MKKKTIVKYLLFLIFPLLLMSCKDNDLEPEENPIYISSKAQKKSTMVKNMIDAYSFDMDKTHDGQLIVLKNDWIKCEYRIADVIHIEVKENTSRHPRKVVLNITSFIKGTTLEIIQAGG